MNGSAVARGCVCVFLLAAIFAVLPLWAEEIPDVTALQAKAENGDAISQCQLGYLFYKGEGVPKDPKKAVEWYGKAAAQNIANAQYCLGLSFMSGYGVSMNVTKAIEWIRKAAVQGMSEAQGLLGACYAKGEGVSMDTKQAIEWYRKAAIQGSPIAQHALGLCYAKGEGVPKDAHKAVEWLTRSAEQGYAKAQCGLGLCYAVGEGVPCDPVRAYKWFNISAAQGDQEAIKSRKLAEEMMTPEQIVQAQRLSSIFVPRSFAEKRDLPPAAGSPNSSIENLVGSGTGFFVTTDGWLVTNAHVATAGTRAMVKVGDTSYPAVVKQVDAANDLALLKVEGQFKALAIERARGATLGASVFTVGFPNPGLQGYFPKMTKGEISSLAGAKDDPRYFQISVPIQPGNSGGALADASGNVIGVVTAKLSDAAGYETSGAIPQNVNYAIKSTYLLALVESIPEVSKGLKEPVKAQDFTAAVQAVEKAAAIVLMFE